MSEQKPREFWINPSTMVDSFNRDFRMAFESKNHTHSGEIHVIEYSAYEALEKEFEKFRATQYRLEADDKKELESERAKVATCVKALEFYVEIKNHIRLLMTDGKVEGGRVAEEALAKIKGES